MDYMVWYGRPSTCHEARLRSRTMNITTVKQLLAGPSLDKPRQLNVGLGRMTQPSLTN